jgi:hypothetical protein
MPVTLDRSRGPTGRCRRQTTAQQFPPELAAVPASRGFVRRHVPDPEFRDDAMLLTSELAANAVQHAGTPFAVTVVTGPDILRVEVSDDSCQAPTVLCPPDGAERGRGLQIVRRVAARWGVDIRVSGKAVWFELGSGQSDLDLPRTEDGSRTEDDSQTGDGSRTRDEGVSRTGRAAHGPTGHDQRQRPSSPQPSGS